MLSSFFLSLSLNNLFTSPLFFSLPFLQKTGYTRVACAAYAFSVALTNPVQFMAFYSCR
jgi:hypothetical protein